MNSIDPSHFIQSHYYGVLSTQSVAEPGYPFGSITPYIITEQGDLAIFISHLAEHTQNINSNPKVSLTIFDAINTENPSSGSRMTCLAKASKSNEEDVLRALYRKQFPQSEMILTLPGFHFYVLKLSKIRLISGFGQVKWLDRTQFSL